MYYIYICTIYIYIYILSNTNSLEVWNSLPKELKLSNLLNNYFKHALKHHFSKKLKNMEQHIFAYYLGTSTKMTSLYYS